MSQYERDTCFRCDLLLLLHSSGPLSDVTPGDDFELLCTRQHFRIDGYADESAWAEAIVRSRDCEDFTARKVRR